MVGQLLDACDQRVDDMLGRAPGSQTRQQHVTSLALDERGDVGLGVGADEQEARERLEAAASEVASQQAEAATEIETLRADFEARLTEIQTEATAAKESAAAEVARQAEDFDKEQAQRQDAEQERWSALEDEIRVGADGLVDDLQEMKTKSEGLLGAVGAAAVANHFQKNANSERMAYWCLFGVTALFGLLAVTAAGLAAARPGDEVERFIGKLALSVALGGVAAYTGSQARDRRESEKHSRRLELELKAFGPFIEDLPPKEKVRERIIMARRTFGLRNADPDGEERVKLVDNEEAEG